MFIVKGDWLKWASGFSRRALLLAGGYPSTAKTSVFAVAFWAATPSLGR
ncbi:hypothetical protein SynA1840_01012 [Synechococcus sp. A18-40]|nr:hypothetical protein SynA1840_01012 [Synechococcus sp. A18-40]